jgi:hypothetical protein
MVDCLDGSARLPVLQRSAINTIHERSTSESKVDLVGASFLSIGRVR